MGGMILVGVDGSAESDEALVHAAEDARRRGARLRVLAVARMPEYWAIPYGMSVPVLPPAELDDEARAVAQAAVDKLFAARPDLADGLAVEVVGATGNPADILVAQARDADGLVLGHRGRGALARAVLGSVGLSCVLHAPCPVTIVRTAPDAARPAG